jgi:hypothetical protein
MRYLLAFCLACGVFAAQPVGSYTRFCATCGVLGAESVLSQSGQFVAHGITARTFPPLRAPGEPALILLEPELIAVTAERTKRAFLDELGMGDAPHDKVHVLLLSQAKPDHNIGIVSQMHTDGFQYQVGLPIYLEPGRMIKALVQALLQEFANRGARRNAELPTWLVEGMTRQLMTSVVPAPVVNRTPLTVERLGFDRLGSIRGYFQTNNPLSIQELSFSNLAAMSAEERFRYEGSAHLLVHELLRLRSGKVMMREFVRGLTQTLNWQTAFYNAYRQYFRTPLDFEKWWMLSCVEVRKQEERQAWSTAASLDRLDSLLRVPLEYRTSTNTIPQTREASLQELIRSTDFAAQKNLLGQKLQQLYFLGVNLSAEVAPVANAYEDAIDSYLQKRSLTDHQPALKSDPAQRIQAVERTTLSTLDQLDTARRDLKEGRKPRLPQRARPSGRQVLITRGSTVE